MLFGSSILRTFLLCLLSVACAGSARAQRAQLVAADDRGLTLRLQVPEWSLSPTTGGRSMLMARGLEMSGIPGRAFLPYAAALIAIPPGGRAVARVTEAGAEELREGVKLGIALKPGLRDDGGALGVVPTMDEVPPIADGPWPGSPVELGQPFTVRRQRVVAIRLYPFRYDEATGRLWARRALTVRIEFQGGASAAPETRPESDGHFEPVLKGTILNYEQGRRWRIRRAAPEESLFPGPRSGSRIAPGGAAQPSGFDEDEPEVRVKLDTTGVYGLEFAQLKSHGYPDSVPVNEVSVHRHEFVESSSPPYETVELPIEVDDRNGNGTFDPGDRILLWIQSWAERSRASVAQRVWGDAEVVYATRLRGRNGLRVPAIAGRRPGLDLPRLTSYPWSQHWEQNLGRQDPLGGYWSTPPDTNTDQFFWTSSVELYALPDSFQFEINDLDPSPPADFKLVWQGRRANPHINWAQIRNASGVITSIADSVVWSGSGPLVREVTLPGSALSNGNRNVLRAWGKTDNGANDQVVYTSINYFEAVYWRSYKALNGYLSCNSGPETGDFLIQADFFRSNRIRVYDVTDSLAPMRLALDDSLIFRPGPRWSVRFDGNAAAGVRHYVVIDSGKVVPPDHYGTVTRRNLYAQSGDYLMIVPEAFLDAVTPLVSLRDSLGFHVVVAPLESVNDEFNGGRHSSYSIRRLVRYAYDRWNAQFVLLVGDGSEDPLDFAGKANPSSPSGPDWVPAQKVFGPVGIGDGFGYVQEIVPSDPWYVWCVDCVPCPPPNQGCLCQPSDLQTCQPYLHDLFIGRLPVNSLEQATDVVNKILAFERITPDQTWRRDMLLVADDHFSTQSFFGGGGSTDPDYCRRAYEDVFLEISKLIRSVILDEGGLALCNPEIFDLNYWLRDEHFHERSPGDTCRDSWFDTQQHCHINVTPEMIQRLNAGRLWWNFQGHANPSVLTHEDLYVNRGINDDKDMLMNYGKPFFFSGFSCHPNAFARVAELDYNIGPALGEEMVTLPPGPGKTEPRGAVASWASSAYEILPNTATTHINVHLARALFADPPRDTSLADRGARVVLGEAIEQALLNNVEGPYSSGYGLEREVGISYILLGDPATRLSIGASQIVVTANGVPVIDGEPVRLYTVGDTLRLEADIVSNVSISSIGLERREGPVTRVIPPADYTITPAFPDTSLSGAGGRKYHLTYRTTLAVGSFRYTILTVDRNGVPGSFDVVFQFISVLRYNAASLKDGDAVSPDASAASRPAGSGLTLLVISPQRVGATDFALTLDGTNQPYLALPASADTSGREWVVTWDHAAYAAGSHRVELKVATVDAPSHTFRVELKTRLENVVAFPNPFDDELGVRFSFYLVSTAPADVLLRVFTVSGRLVYERHEHALDPVYHQLAWDGRDAEGQKLANGIYFFKLLARNSSGSTVYEGRLVKLRKPRRAAPETETP